MNDHNETAVGLLRSLEFMAIASASRAGKAWNSPVFFAYDGDLNFYWNSVVEARHSQNMAENSSVAIVIFDASSKAGVGVYLTAEVDELSDRADVERARDILMARGFVSHGSAADFMAPSNRRMYRARPTAAWLNDADEVDGEYTRDYRVELDLEELKGTL